MFYCCFLKKYSLTFILLFCTVVFKISTLAHGIKNNMKKNSKVLSPEEIIDFHVELVRFPLCPPDLNGLPSRASHTNAAQRRSPSKALLGSLVSGFSLVEILVALIIVSLITAALAPVITKKLSSSSITIIGGGSGGGGAAEEDTPENLELKKQVCELNKKYWDTVTKKCLDCEIEGCAKCTASGPYGCDECADSGFVFTDGACVGDPCTRYGAITLGKLCVTARNIGDDPDHYASIPNTQGACKTGLQTANTCTEDSGSYSGCRRTVCTRPAAKTACWNLDVKGLKGWRLPTSTEANDFGSLPELQLCTNTVVAGKNRCTKGSGNWPYVIWTQREDTCASDAYYNYAYNSTSWQQICSYDDGGARAGSYNSVRCVISRCRAIDNHCQECDDKKCTLCDYDYEVNQYGKCQKCEEGYSYSPTTKKCEKDPCNKYDAVAIDNLCVSKRNYGDSDYYTYVAPTSGACSQNVALTNYTNDNGDYSGSPRTLCNRTGAANACGKLNIKGLTGWRLPMLSEMSHWNSYNKGLGNGGIMLCSSNQINGVSWCPLTSSKWPYVLWAGTIGSCVDGSDYAYTNYAYLNGSWKSLCSYAEGGARPGDYNSVRCVIDRCKALDKHCVSCTNEKCTTCEKDYHPDENGVCVKCPEGTLYNSSNGKCEVDTCLKYDAITINDLCVARRNYGDSQLYSYTAPTSGDCKQAHVSDSWSDANGSYPGSPRTICNRAAAQVVCINLDVQGLTGWRLPNISEQIDWEENSTNLGDGGLMICSKSSGGYGTSHCGNSATNIAPHMFWSTSGSTCASDAYHKYGFINNYGQHCSYADSGARAGDYSSVRCVINKCRSIEHCAECSNNACTKCERDYFVKDGKCEACPSGQLYDETSGQCKIDKCLKYDAITINGLCVQRRNYGDSTYYNYKAPTSGACHVAYSTLGGTKQGTYQATPRTLCNRAASRVVCGQMEVQGLSGWRLPKLEEMVAWGTYSTNLGDGGLNLCSSNQIDGASYCPKSSAGGSTGWPNVIWSDTSSTCASDAYYTYYYGSSYGKICSYDDGGARAASFNSVRCVIETSKLP